MGLLLRTHITALPLTVAERLDAVCDRFEAACGGGLRPRIGDYLEGVEEPARAVLARELIVLDLHYRHGRAEVPQVTDYDSVNPDRESNWLACAVAALTEGSAPPELPGYEILGELGRGGMGVVYKAQDHRLGRLVALKVLHGPRCKDPEALERFRREARTASALNHPHICTIYTLEEHRGQPFLVMEFIEGHTLRARVDAGPPLAQLLRWIGQVARALQAAHAAGIVHRDIKPENLLVRPDDVVKVLDFGVARLLPDGALRALTLTGKATDPGTLIGTARYMAPEQARCEAVGSPADLFSLGIVLYELATGRHPFEAASALGTLNALIEQQPLSPSRLNPKLTGALEGLMLRMLEKDPRRRPPADEVAAVLDGLALAPILTLTSPGIGWDGGSQPAGKPRPVGRRRELAELDKGFASALAGRGLLTCVTGEPGLGKTTLVESFLEDLLLRGHSFHLARGCCSERLAGSEAYLPVLEALENLLRGPGGAALAETMKRLAPNWYGQVIPRAADDSSFTRRTAEAPTATQERLKRELIAFLEEVGRARPVLFFLDDLHWADASTLDLLVYLGSRAGSLRLLLVATYRPADLLRSHHPFCLVQLDLQGRGLCRVIALEFLSQPDVERYLSVTFPGHAFPTGFAALVHAKTEGNPLFLVDLLQYLRDRHVLADEGGRWVLAQAVPDLGRELPQSVRSMIQRLIDQLTDDERRLLLAASVQGQEFDAAVVAEVLALDATEVEERLEVLDRVRGLVRRVGEYQLPDRTPTLRYAFVHTLYQNALYEGLQPSRKVAFSAAVARALLQHHGETGGGVTAELALLFEAARDGARAADFFLRAAQKAFRVFANQEAAALARRGLEQLGPLPDTPERRRCELRLQMALGVSLRATRGFADAEVEQAHARALKLCGEVEPTVAVLPGPVGAVPLLRGPRRGADRRRTGRAAPGPGHGRQRFRPPGPGPRPHGDDPAAPGRAGPSPGAPGDGPGPLRGAPVAASGAALRGRPGGDVPGLPGLGAVATGLSGRGAANRKRRAGAGGRVVPPVDPGPRPFLSGVRPPTPPGGRRDARLGGGRHRPLPGRGHAVLPTAGHDLARLGRGCPGGNRRWPRRHSRGPGCRPGHGHGNPPAADPCHARRNPGRRRPGRGSTGGHRRGAGPGPRPGRMRVRVRAVPSPGRIADGPGGARPRPAGRGGGVFRASRGRRPPAGRPRPGTAGAAQLEPPVRRRC